MLDCSTFEQVVRDLRSSFQNDLAACDDFDTPQQRQQCKRRACPSILLRCTPLAEDKYPKMGIGSEPSRANQRRLEELIDLYPRTVSDGHFAHVAD